ncbi:MAG: dihydrolipoyl dehydrogenase [Proteobacteria bacterium]|nr:dihydrolipoyl dehydrogenase [Pseudomonadota bacterium]
MTNEEYRFDLVVVGSGPGGYSAAIRGAQKKLRVAIIEKDKPGGTCLNRGCIPTKALLYDTTLISKVQRMPYVKNTIKYSFQDVMARKNEVVTNSVKGFEALLFNLGVQLRRGDASLATPRSVRVRGSDGSTTTLEGNNIVLATGTAVRYPSALKVDGEKIIGTAEALDLKELPKRLAVVGGDHQGVEFATIFQCLGSDVVLIEKERRLLATEDHEMSSRLKQILAGRMKIMTRAEVVKAEEKSRDLVLTIETKKGVEELAVDKTIVVGERIGHVDGLGLERMGLSLNGGFVKVGPTMETSAKNIFAVGDLVGGGLYAHKALAEGVVAVDTILGSDNRRENIFPRVIFTDPEIGAVGLTEREAEEKEGSEGILVGKFPMEASGRAMTLAEPKGSVKIIAGKKYGEILGVHIFGPQATEVIALACLAIKNELSIHELRESLFAHPTLSETFHEAVLSIWGEAIHFYAEP